MPRRTPVWGGDDAALCFLSLEVASFLGEFCRARSPPYDDKHTAVRKNATDWSGARHCRLRDMTVVPAANMGTETLVTNVIANIPKPEKVGAVVGSPENATTLSLTSHVHSICNIYISNL